MKRVFRNCLAGLLVSASLEVRASELGTRLKVLAERWRWDQYWEGSTGLAGLYELGRQFSALVFWKSRGALGDAGFCSSELRVCRYYPNVPGNEHSFQWKMDADRDVRAEVRRFREEGLVETRLPVAGPGAEAGARQADDRGPEWVEVMTRITLPSLEPPEAIRERRRPPARELQELQASLGCRAGETACRVHLLVPFYGANDPNVPVWRECRGCGQPRPMVLFMKRVEGRWWHGAMDFNDQPGAVERLRGRILDALVLEVGAGAGKWEAVKP